MNKNILNQFYSKVNSLPLKRLVETNLFEDKLEIKDKITLLKKELETNGTEENFWIDVELSELEKSLNTNSQNFNEYRLSLIPDLFLDEVNKLISKQYQNNLDSYFNDVSLYFDCISIFDLFVLNTDKEDLKTFAYNVFDSKIHASRKIIFGEHRAYRQLLRYKKKKIAHIQALLKLVGKGAKKYCSDSLLKLYKRNIRSQIKFIESYQVMNEDGELFDLKKCVKTYEQNKAEKINLSKAMDKLATDKGFVWSLITLTILPNYHPNPTLGTNSYDGTAIDESAKDVNKRFNNVRAMLSKQDIDNMYCKVSEVHADGCFHFHILFYCLEENLQNVKNAFTKHFPNMLLTDKNGSVAIDNQGNKVLKQGVFKTQDKTKTDSASGSSYIFKYITKAVTFYNPDLDLDKLDKSEYNTLLNSAMRSFASIRGIQFGGISGCLTKFRFLARNKTKFSLPIQLQEILEENNLYEFIKSGYSDLIETMYEDVVNQAGEVSKRFLGVKLHATEMVKSFFKLIRNCVNDMPKAFQKKKISFKLRKVLVNHNYSRENQKQLQKQLE
jgi:hypothetical protein